MQAPLTVSSALTHISSSSSEQTKLPELPPGELCVRRSVFHVTVSTNIRYQTQLALAKGCVVFGNALKQAYETDLRRLIKILTPGDSYDEHVGSVHIQTTLEYSWSSGLHSHSIVECIHTTKIHIDPKALNESLQRHAKWDHDRTGKKYRVFIQFVKNYQAGAEAVKRYIFKQVRGKQRKICEGIEFPEEFQFSHSIDIAEMVIKRAKS